MSESREREGTDLQRLESVLQLNWLIFGNNRVHIQVPQALAEHVQRVLQIASLELSVKPLAKAQHALTSAHRAPSSFNLSAMAMYCVKSASSKPSWSSG